MTIVVGYIPTREGLAAVEHAMETATSSIDRLVVVNSGVRGKDADASFLTQGTGMRSTSD